MRVVKVFPLALIGSQLAKLAVQKSNWPVLNKTMDRNIKVCLPQNVFCGRTERSDKDETQCSVQCLNIPNEDIGFSNEHV